jgi:hypothetical protein
MRGRYDREDTENTEAPRKAASSGASASKAPKRRHIFGAAVSDPWLGISTYKDLVDVNARFVRGELSSSPYHLGPLEPDSLPLVDNLLELHRRGIVTVEGQSSACVEAKYQPRIWKDARGNKRGQEYYDMQQRPYLDFYIEKSPKADKLMDSLLASADYAVILRDMSTGKCRTNIKLGQPGVFQAKGASKNIEKSFDILNAMYDSKNLDDRDYDKYNRDFDKHAFYYNVTRSRTHRDADKLSRVKWSMYTNLNPMCLGSDFRRHPNISKAIKNTYKVCVAGRKYCEGDVEGALVTLCDQLGITG